MRNWKVVELLRIEYTGIRFGWYLPISCALTLVGNNGGVGQLGLPVELLANGEEGNAPEPRNWV